LENVDYHPWVDAISNSIKQGVYLQAIKFPNLDFLISFLRLFLTGGMKNRSFMTEKMKKRMAAGAPAT